MVVEFREPGVFFFFRIAFHRRRGGASRGQPRRRRSGRIEADRRPGQIWALSLSGHVMNLADDGTRATFLDVEADVPADDDGDGLFRGRGSDHQTRRRGIALSGGSRDQRRGTRWSRSSTAPSRRRIGGSSDEPLDWPVTLAARESSGGADFYLNGERIAGLSDSRVTGRAVGLIHCGPGRFVFDNLGPEQHRDHRRGA